MLLIISDLLLIFMFTDLCFIERSQLAPESQVKIFTNLRSLHIWLSRVSFDIIYFNLGKLKTAFMRKYLVLRNFSVILLENTTATFCDLSITLSFNFNWFSFLVGCWNLFGRFNLNCFIFSWLQQRGTCCSSYCLTRVGFQFPSGFFVDSG